MLEQPSPLTFVVPDLHGRLALLEHALEAIENEAPSGTVIFLGNYVDRRGYGSDVVRRLIEGPPFGWTWVSLMGDREDRLVRRVRDADDRTAGLLRASFGDRQMSWLEALPLFHVDAHRLYVHAAIDPGTYETTGDHGRQLVRGLGEASGNPPPNGDELLIGVFDDRLAGGPIRVLKTWCPPDYIAFGMP